MLENTNEQLDLFPQRGRKGEYGPPVASISPLLTDSSLATAAGAFYEHMLRQGFSDNTIKAFLGDLRLLAKFLGQNKPVNEIGTQDLNDFLSWLKTGRGKPCSPKSYARRVTTLKVFFQWLNQAEILPEDPAAFLVHQRATSPLPDILFDSEVDRLLRATRDKLWATKPDARPYVLVSLILQTAIKKAECMAIELDHIDQSNPNQSILHVRHPNPRMTHKERKIALSTQLSLALRQYVNEHKPTRSLFECTARNLEYVLSAVGREAEISKAISFEALRWTSAVLDYRAGTPEDQLRRKLGLSKVTWQDTHERIRRLAAPPL